ncbi:MAG: pilus assembly protein [Clostridia bacterium]|nr:pilus assembly protein [Clostridia bacterium]
MIDFFEKTKSERAAVTIVESAIVFPVMFIILLFLMYMGNAYYVKAQVDAIVVENAIAGANYCADPILESIKRNGGAVPSVKKLEVEPYRYFIGGMDDVEDYIADRVKKQIDSSTISILGEMSPDLKTSKSNIAKFNNYILYSTFSVNVKYDITFPIRLLGSKEPTVMRVNSYAEIAVSDTSEFIRNTDMVIDYFGDSKAGTTIKGAFDKINEVLQTFASK